MLAPPPKGKASPITESLNHEKESKMLYAALPERDPTRQISIEARQDVIKEIDNDLVKALNNLSITNSGKTTTPSSNTANFTYTIEAKNTNTLTRKPSFLNGLDSQAPATQASEPNSDFPTTGAYTAAGLTHGESNFLKSSFTEKLANEPKPKSEIRVR